MLRRRRGHPARGLVAPVLAVGIAIVGLGACGGGSSGAAFVQPSGPSLQTVNIQSGNLFFKPTKITLSKPGIYTIKLTNTASGSHTLVFGDTIKGFRLDVTGNGSSNQKKVDLKAGTYTFWCDVPGHRSAGMQGTITVQ